MAKGKKNRRSYTEIYETAILVVTLITAVICLLREVLGFISALP